VTIVTQEFKNLADSVAGFYAFPDLPMVVVPHPFVTLELEEVRAIADAKAEEIVACLVVRTGPDLFTDRGAEE
jgi:hypothetical protein